MRTRLLRWHEVLLVKRLFPAPVLLVLIGLTALGILTLTWHFLEGKSDLIQYLALVVEIAAFLLLFFAPLEPPPGRVAWKQLQARGDWQAALLTLAIGTWGLFFLWRGPVAAAPGELTTYTVENLCALANEYTTEGALKEFLSRQAREQAQEYFGSGQQMRQLRAPEFYSGANLGEICIRVTFDNGISGQ